MAESPDFVKDHGAHVGDFVDGFKRKVEGCRALGLVRGVVPDGEVAVFKRLLDCDALAGVEGEHAVEKVESVGVCAREELGERDLGHVGQVADVFLGSGRTDAGQC